MFKNKFQGGVISIFSSIGASPLLLWGVKVKNGHIKRITDPDLVSMAVEIVGVNAATTYITIPRNLKQDLGIRLPFVVLIAKNMNRFFSFEITILDDANMKRRFMCSNFQSKTKIDPFFTTMPICLTEGWNKIQFNLADLTRRAYGTLYSQTIRIEVHANVRLKRIYFCEKLYEDEELPKEYRIIPKKTKPKRDDKGEGDGQVGAPLPPGVTPPPSTPPGGKADETAPETPAPETATAEEAPTAAEPAAEGSGEAPPEGEAPVEGAAPAEGDAPTEGEAPAEGDAPAEGGGEEAPPAEEAAEG